ncbi:MAG: DNA mismatch repair protein MutS, partial [Coprococcus sp.]
MEKYQQELTKINGEIKQLEAKYSTYGTIRFIMFLAAIVGLIVGFYDSNIPFLVGGIIATLIFTGLVFVHGKLSEQLEYVKARAIVYDRYIKRYSEEWKTFADNGSEYVTDEDLVAKDMDLIGASSLYQFICVAGTEDGRRQLAASLKNPEYSMEEIKRRQQAVAELAEKKEFSMDFETLGIKANTGKKKKYTADEFVKYCKSDTKIPSIFNVLRFLLPAVTLCLVIAGVMGKLSLGYALISFFAILLFSWLTSGIAGQAVMPMISFGYIIEDYIRMFELISKEDFKNPLMNDIKGVMSENTGAIKAIKKLKSISAAFNIRYNPIVHQVLCGLTMWDFHLGIMMDKWKEQYGDHVENWISSVADVEELLSYAVLARTRRVSYPQVGNSNNVHVKCQDMRHPLIAPDKVVANDACLSGGATIITGSNMSGKTTFLRTLGINLVLAYAGAPVCADNMIADYMKIFTSMRVTDDVSNGISTFYAEILRIKTMVEYKKKSRPMLCLIDEIFKGTNSADRIVGASQVIKKLSDKYSMTIVSTHDFELCEAPHILNYHFSEYYDKDEIKFDYKITYVNKKSKKDI